MYNWWHNEFELNRIQRLQQQAYNNGYIDEQYANRSLKKEQQMLELKIEFNDIALREFGFGLDDDDHVVDLDTETLYQISERFIKYSEDKIPILSANEIDLNLIENPRLMEILFGMWANKWEARNNNQVKVTSYYQSAMRGSKKGFFVMTYLYNGAVKESRSDVFINESVRIFNLITKLNHTDHLYANEINRFDIEIIRKGSK